MNFLHCNFCGFLPSCGENRGFALSSCGHVVCEDCSRGIQTGGSVCFVCQANCRLADVTHDPKPEIKAYFGEPLECLREALGRIGKIAQFQNGQQQRYISLMRKLMDEENSIKMERDALRGENTALKKKLESINQAELDWERDSGFPRGGGDGFFVAPPPPEPSPLFGGHDKKRPLPSPALSTSSGNIHGGRERASPVISLNYGPGRLTRPHNPVQPPQVSRGNPSASNASQRTFPTFSSSNGGSSGYSSLTSLSSTRSSNSRFSLMTPGNTKSSSSLAQTPGILSRIQNLSFRNRPGVGEMGSKR